MNIEEFIYSINKIKEMLFEKIQNIETKINSMYIQLFHTKKRALEQTEQFNNVAYYLDMGLGKTFVDLKS